MGDGRRSETGERRRVAARRHRDRRVHRHRSSRSRWPVLLPGFPSRRRRGAPPGRARRRRRSVCPPACATIAWRSQPRISWIGHKKTTSWQSASPKSPAAARISRMPTGPKWTSRKIADQGPDVAAAADRRAGHERRCDFVNETGGDDEDEPKADRRPELVGDRTPGGHEEIDDGEAQEQQPRRPAQRDEQDVGEHGPDRSAGIRRRLIDRLGAMARGIGRDRSRPGSDPGRRSPGQTRSAAPSATLAGVRTCNPLGAPTSPVSVRLKPDTILVGSGALPPFDRPAIRGPCDFKRTESRALRRALFNLPVG